MNGQASPLPPSPPPERLVQIERGTAPLSPIHRLFAGPFVDKFFLAGALSALLGIGLFGVQLWMMLNRTMEFSSHYLRYRDAHILLQEYLFLNLFLYGFLMQTTAKVYQAPILPPATTILLIPLLGIGALLSFVAQEQFLGPFLLASAPVFVALWVRRALKEGRSDFRVPHSRFLFLGLFTLAAQPFFDMSIPLTAFIFLTLGAFPIILAASQQFIIAFLGGARLTNEDSKVLLGGILTVGISLLLEAAGAPLSHFAGATLVVTLIYFSVRTGLTRSVREQFVSPLGFSFLSGILWSIIAGGILAFYGTTYLDIAFHLIVIGFVVPLIVSVSTQIIRHLSGAVKVSDRQLSMLLIIWQVVPFGRASALIGGLPRTFSIVVAIAAILLLVGWTFAIWSGSFSLLRKQLHGAMKCPLLSKGTKPGKP